MEKHDQDIPWGAVAFVFVLLAGLLLFVFLVSRDPGHPPDQQTAQPLPDIQQFWVDVAGLIPDYKTFDAQCPVDQTTIHVPNSTTDNILGGVTTDLMKIAINPSDDGSSRPRFELQDFEQKLVTCPSCAATYIAVDLSFIIGDRLAGSAEKIKDWQLNRVIPGIDLAGESEWTYDVRSYLRYQTQLQAGYPASETAYAALAGAYCSNFAVWYGREYTIPSPALYALAAARLREDLENELPENTSARSANAMLLGEIYRLLGRSSDAAHWFAEAKHVGVLDPGIVVVLEASEARLASSDFSLARIPSRAEMQPPPFGWQVDFMLPNINGHISQFREQWSVLDDPAEIEDAIAQVINEKHKIQ